MKIENYNTENCRSGFAPTPSFSSQGDGNPDTVYNSSIVSIANSPALNNGLAKKSTRNLVSGFTFVEMLVVVAVLALLLSLTIGSFTSLRDSRTLERDVAEVLSRLERARANTIAARENNQYGIYATTTFVTLFSGDTFTLNDPNNERYTFAGDVALTDISLGGGGTTIIFDRLTGATTGSGTLTFTLTAPSTTTTSSIQIDATGVARRIK